MMTDSMGSKRLVVRGRAKFAFDDLAVWAFCVGESVYLRYLNFAPYLSCSLRPSLEQGVLGLRPDS